MDIALWLPMIVVCILAFIFILRMLIKFSVKKSIENEERRNKRSVKTNK